MRELEDTLGKARTFVGTLSYMSPERMRAEPYTYKSDIWSFGVSLLSCAQGRFPFPETASYWELLEELGKKGELDLPPHFSANFKDFLRQSLKKDPAQRLTARQLLRHPWLRSQSLAALAADQEEAAAEGANDGSNTARNDLAEICDTVMGKYLEYAASKLQKRLPLSQALIGPLDKSRLKGLARQLGLSTHIVSGVALHALVNTAARASATPDSGQVAAFCVLRFACSPLRPMCVCVLQYVFLQL